MENETLLDKSKIQGQIYLITNIATSKQYVGQAVTHRNNHNKYRPFGYMGRFRDHISEALCNTKKKQCRYLNNSIRLYGADKFKVELLYTCPVEELDSWESHYIKEYNSLYPNGYNLTLGGKVFRAINESVCELTPTTPGKRGGCKERTPETRKKMSERLCEVMGTEENRKRQMSVTQNQHKNQKFERFRGESIDLENLDKYIYVKHAKGIPFVVIKVNKKQASFVGKYETLDQLKETAKEFLRKIATTATLPN